MPALSSSTRSAAAGFGAALAVLAAYTLGGHGNSKAEAAEPAAGDTTQGITVVGHGKVTGIPDTLLLDMGVVVKRDSVADALADANAKLDKVTNVLLHNGVAKRDVQTSGLSIDPNYDYVSGHEVLTGYSVHETLSAKIHDLHTAGDTIGAAAGAGGDAVRIDSIAYDIEDDAALLAQARDAAFAEAKAKAQQYAADADRGLGRVESVSEHVTNANPQPYYGRSGYDGLALAAPKGLSVPLSRGTQKVTVSITTVWSFD